MGKEKNQRRLQEPKGRNRNDTSQGQNVAAKQCHNPTLYWEIHCKLSSYSGQAYPSELLTETHRTYEAYLLVYA